LTSDGNTVHFQSGDVVISSRVINGKFPPYKRFFPDNEDNDYDSDPWTFKIAVREFANMVEIAAVTADTDGKIILTIEDNDQGGRQLLIQSGTSTESGLSTYTIQLEGTISDERVQVAVNAKFLIESINASPAEHVEVQIFDETKGVVLGTQTWKSVVQPMPL
jgi:DNA polymerase III sliding clamp (beta) subunit (PCNA family)